MSANPIVDVLQMMMQMYGDMTDRRSNIEPGSGRPGTTSVNPNVNMLVDATPPLPNREGGPTRAEIDAITKSVMYEKMLKREMEESQLAPQPRQLQKMNPDIWRYLDQLKPTDDPNFRQYLAPDTPDPIGMQQRILQLASLTQTGDDGLEEPPPVVPGLPDASKDFNKWRHDPHSDEDEEE